MKVRSTSYLVVVLLLLLFMSASGLCAAFLPQIHQRYHDCCPSQKVPSDGNSLPSCCHITNGPLVPSSIIGPEAAWNVSANVSAIQISSSASEPVFTRHSVPPASGLYVRF